MIKLGHKVKDIITGYKGTVIGRAEYVTGCVQLCVVPPVDKDGKPPGRQLDRRGAPRRPRRFLRSPCCGRRRQPRGPAAQRAELQMSQHIFYHLPIRIDSGPHPLFPHMGSGPFYDLWQKCLDQAYFSARNFDPVSFARFNPNPINRPNPPKEKELTHDELIALIAKELGIAYPKTHPFKTGDLVRVKSSLTKAHYGWCGVNPGDIGKVTKTSENTVHIDFPSHHNWCADPSELEIAPRPKVGDRVRIVGPVRFNPPIPDSGLGQVGVIDVADQSAFPFHIKLPDGKGSWRREQDVVLAPAAVPAPPVNPFEVGDLVRRKGEETTGTVLQLHGGLVDVAFRSGIFRRTVACSYLELVPKPVPRPKVGDTVKITGGDGAIPRHVGKVGVIERDDNSYIPFYIKFSNGEFTWRRECSVVKVGPSPQTPLEEAQDRIEGFLKCHNAMREWLGAKKHEPLLEALQRAVSEAHPFKVGDKVERIGESLYVKTGTLGEVTSADGDVVKVAWAPCGEVTAYDKKNVHTGWNVLKKLPA